MVRTSILNDAGHPNYEEWNQRYFDDNHYSHGWLVYEMNGEQALGHDGSVGTFYISSLLIPASETTICIAANAATDQCVNLIYQIRDILLKK